MNPNPLAFLLVAALTVGGGCAAPTKPKKVDPQTQAAQKLRMADSYFRAGRTSDALLLLDEAIALDPANAGIRNYYGQLCFMAGRLTEAEAALRKAIEIDPYLADAHNNLGAVLDRLGRKDEAEASFRKVLQDPSYPTPEKVWLNLGLLYGSQGRNDDAIRALRQAVEISPKYYQAHFELASLLDRTGKLEEAAREYEVAAPDYRTDGTFHYRLGLVYFKLRDMEKAREHLLRVRDVSPGSENSAKADEVLKVIR